MPLVYSSPTVVEAAKSAKTIVCVGVNIRLPRSGTQSVTYYYEDLDASGAVVRSWSVMITVPDLAESSPGLFTDVHRLLKADAYKRAQSYLGNGTVS